MHFRSMVSKKQTHMSTMSKKSVCQRIRIFWWLRWQVLFWICLLLTAVCLHYYFFSSDSTTNERSALIRPSTSSTSGKPLLISRNFQKNYSCCCNFTKFFNKLKNFVKLQHEFKIQCYNFTKFFNTGGTFGGPSTSTSATMERLQNAGASLVTQSDPSRPSTSSSSFQQWDETSQNASVSQKNLLGNFS